MKNFDIIVIGFGKAGKTLAMKAAARSKRVALVEKSTKMYGGTCINVGCIPTKKLITLSKQAKFHTDKESYFASCMQEKDKLTAALNAKNYDMLKSANVEIFNATASFVDQNTILLNELNEQISAQTIIINTGSKSITPKFKINSDIVYQSDEILQLQKLPRHIVIVGGGFIGLEFASMYANFGVKVTILARSEILKGEDEELKTSVLNMLKSQNIDVLTNVDVKSICGNEIFFNDTSLVADAFLLALGREPNVAELKLQNAGVTLENGKIATNEFLQTSKESIFAVGDVRGEELFTFISLDDFRIVESKIYKDAKRTKNNRSPYAKVVFTDVAFAMTGASKSFLEQEKVAFKELKVMLANVPNAKILGNDYGFLKAYVSAVDGTILGAVFHCHNAHELINQISLAIKFNAKASDLAGQIFTHPSTSEALNDLFAQFAG